MVDECTKHWLETNKFLFQYEIDEFGLRVYKNKQSIIFIDSRSVMGSMYPIDYFKTEEDEMLTMVNDYLKEIRSREREMTENKNDVKQPEKKKKIKPEILEKIQEQEKRWEEMWLNIMKKKK